MLAKQAQQLLARSLATSFYLYKPVVHKGNTCTRFQALASSSVHLLSSDPGRKPCSHPSSKVEKSLEPDLWNETCPTIVSYKKAPPTLLSLMLVGSCFNSNVCP